MRFMLAEPRNQSFQELLGNGTRYEVPRFQRDYAWTLEQWEDLWADIEGIAKEQCHYMGYIVLQRKGQHDFQVIDGQQRLVTLTLVILAAMKNIERLAEDNIEREKNLTRLELLTERFIGFRSSVTLKVSGKLQLNRNNSRHFKLLCSDLKPPNPVRLTLTNELLNNAFCFFQSQNMGETGEDIAEFIERFTSAMLFTRIVVEDDLNAYKVFETLNARGVQLSAPDLLKNHIFSVMTANDELFDEELDELDEIWAAIISQLGENDFSDFIRHHHAFQQKNDSGKKLFSNIKKSVQTTDGARNYLNSLNEYAPIYAVLLKPDDEWWKKQNPVYGQAKKYLQGLALFNIRQPFSILMAAFHRFSPAEFVRLCRYLYVLTVRYDVVCRLSPAMQAQKYNELAMKIQARELTRASHVKNSEAFKALYPDDGQFANAFSFFKMPSRQSAKKIRFLLAEIETHLGHGVDYTRTTLEHVCPYQPNEWWRENFQGGKTDIRDRLGNMILLEKDELKRADFAEKKAIYGASPFVLARQVATYNEWDLHGMNHFQDWLAEQAVSTWEVS